MSWEPGMCVCVLWHWSYPRISTLVFYVLIFFFVASGIRADKKDDELFFIDSKKKPTSKLDTFDEQTKGLQDAMNDLRCYRNLKADENSEPALLRNNKEKQLTSKKTSRKADSIRSKIERQKPIRSSRKKDKEPNDNRFTFVHDLWTTNFNPEVNHTNEYFLRTTKKIMPKVGLRASYPFV